MSTISINGSIIQNVSGSINILGNRIIIDGKDMTPDAKEITVIVQGNIEILEIDYAKSISIDGDVSKMRSGSGNVKITGSVKGDVQAGSGDIECEEIAGDAQTGSGDIKAKFINGKCKTGSGDIYGSAKSN